MPKLKLDDIAVGTPSKPYTGYGNHRKDLDPFDSFIAARAKPVYEKAPTLAYATSNFPDLDACHTNYLSYLEKCWSDHLGVVFTPDILWYTILCELVAVVKDKPEQYRSLFSESDEKQHISIPSGSLVVMPLADLLDALKSRVPANADLFMPQFSTSDDRTRHAQIAAFCDMCSPYYDYSMFACGIPWIDVRGESFDYTSISINLSILSTLFPDHHKWFIDVQEIVAACVVRRDDPTWWSKMFWLERCGSGGETEVSGWFKLLFLKQPRVRFVRNYTSGISLVDYRSLSTGVDYRMMDGLFASRMEDEFLVPQFASCVFEKIPPV